MQLVFFDDISRLSLLPFTHTRPIADIRCGILTFRERWEKLLGFSKSGSLTEAYLQPAFPTGESEEWLLIRGGVFGTAELAAAVRALQPGQSLKSGDEIVAARYMGAMAPWDEMYRALMALPSVTTEHTVLKLGKAWEIFSFNDAQIRADFKLLCEGRTSAALPSDVVVRGTEIFIEEGAQIGAGTVINATTGPVYIGKKTEIMEGCMLRGPLAVCENAGLKMSAKIYGATTIGPGSKVGGEVNNVVFFANSNKGHDGFLGNAVIGEWCNLGADTNCSNLKNNYDEVKVWDETAGKLVKTGLTFCGLLMGDHSKAGINTMFNTGTVAGVSCNIWGGGFPEKFIPSFSWGGSEGMSTYQFDRAIETAQRMMARRGKSLSPEEQNMLKHIFETTSRQRALQTEQA